MPARAGTRLEDLYAAPAAADPRGGGQDRRAECAAPRGHAAPQRAQRGGACSRKLSTAPMIRIRPLSEQPEENNAITDDDDDDDP